MKDRIIEALTNLADELEAEIRARYGFHTDKEQRYIYDSYPSERRRFENDMYAVNEARKLIEELNDTRNSETRSDVARHSDQRPPASRDQ